jgi:dynein heavy chain
VQVPALLDVEAAGPSTFIVQENGLLSSLAIVLSQVRRTHTENRIEYTHVLGMVARNDGSLLGPRKDPRRVYKLRDCDVGEQEVVKFNRLLTAMSASLTDLQKAIKGLIVMTLDLDKMYTSFLTNKVPGLWYVRTASCIQGRPTIPPLRPIL